MLAPFGPPTIKSLATALIGPQALLAAEIGKCTAAGGSGGRS